MFLSVYPVRPICIRDYVCKTVNPSPCYYVSAVDLQVLKKRLVGKREIVGDEQFLLFPVFSTRLENFLPYSSNLKLSSANLKFVVWESVK